MSNLKHPHKQRVLSIERKKLTLSGSKISISSLSSNLIKFFQAQESINPANSMQSRFSKKRTSSLHYLSIKKYENRTKMTELPSTDYSNSQADQYGLQSGRNRKKRSDNDQNEKNAVKIELKKSRISSLNGEKLLRIQNCSATKQQSSYLNFTFGSEKLNLGSKLKTKIE